MHLEFDVIPRTALKPKDTNLVDLSEMCNLAGGIFLSLMECKLNFDDKNCSLASCSIVTMSFSQASGLTCAHNPQDSL